VVNAIVVDLDDTLYPQSQYLACAVRATSERARELGVEGFEPAFLNALEEGSDKGGRIDAALLSLGTAPDRVKELVPDLVEAFTGCTPAPGELTFYPGAREALVRARDLGHVILVTDGAPRIQRAKMASLDVLDLVDTVVITDEFGGREFRKPDTRALATTLSELELEPGDCVFVGDRPGKDVEVARRLGLASVRVRTGEYAHVASEPAPTWEVTTFAEAIELLESFH
jgi:putative hydrolase of the HAD superfamily